jgi:predicted amidohydrolase YtcJ
MRKIRLFVFVIFLGLTSCTTVKTTSIEPASIHPDTAAQTPHNLALGKQAEASNLTLENLPWRAVDGSLESLWNGGQSAPQWIQVDLGSPSTISSMRLTVSQYPAGETLHQVYAGPSPTELTLVHEFNGITKDSDVLEFTPPVPLNGIRYVKIETTQSPSWVAWREIEILGNEENPASSPEPGKGVADIIYINGTILTMEQDQPTAEAIALRGDTILAVGSQVDVLAYQGDATRLIDLHGLTLTPGFIDSHAHRIGDRWQYGDVSAEQVMETALSQGWTGLHELFVNDQRLNELVALDAAHALTLRVSMYLTMNNEYTRNDWWTGYQPLHQYSPYLQIAGLKITLDRNWGQQVFFTQEQYTQVVLAGTQKGWQIATHSFSPTANQIVLNGYAAGLNGGNNDTLRLRLEHIGTITDAELQQMADLGIIGSVQLINSGFFPNDPTFYENIPAEEIQHTARWRDLINAGVYLIGNSDDPWCCTDWKNNFQAPSHDATVVTAIFQGVTFNIFSGRQPEAWQTAQAVTVQEALEMLTIRGAYAAHQENVIGSLKAGKYADLVILSANPLSTPIDEIPTISVVMTMVGGEVKYCAAGQESVCSP